MTLQWVPGRCDQLFTVYRKTTGNWMWVAETTGTTITVTVPNGEVKYRVSGLCANQEEVWRNDGMWVKRGLQEVTR